MRGECMLQSLREAILNYLVLKPSRHAIEHSNQRRECVLLNNRSIDFFIQQNFAPPEKADLLVLKFPGTAGRAERSTSFPGFAIPNLKTEIWTWNPPGYGGSEGNASLRNIAEAALLYWDFARSRHGDQIPIWLFGNSLGCLSVLHIGSKRISNDIDAGMILRNPPPLINVVKRVAKKYPFGSAVNAVANSLCDEMNAMITAPQCSLPALFLQSQRDELVPTFMQNEVIESYGGPSRKVILEGLDHDGKVTPTHHEMIRDGIHWLQSQIHQC